MLKTNFNFDGALGAPALGDEATSACGSSGPDQRAPQRLDEPADLRLLCDLSPGRDAVIASVDASGPIGRRLLDLGLLPGTRVHALRHAPLGDPSVFELRGYRLCLRRSESRRVRLRPQSHTPPAKP